LPILVGYRVAFTTLDAGLLTVGCRTPFAGMPVW
jgi:hypothetical protein